MFASLETADVAVVRAVARAPALERLAGQLSAEERHRAQGLRVDAARAAYICAHALKRTLIGTLLDVAPASLEFHADPGGPPRLVAPSARLHFSLSHAGTAVGVLVSGAGPVGLDLEVEPEEPPAPGLLELALHADERRACGASPDPRTFCRLWTLKEAYVKALGLGVRLPFDRLVVHGTGARVEVRGPQAGWQFSHRRIGARTHLATCRIAGRRPLLIELPAPGTMRQGPTAVTPVAVLARRP